MAIIEIHTNSCLPEPVRVLDLHLWLCDRILTAEIPTSILEVLVAVVFSRDQMMQLICCSLLVSSICWYWIYTVCNAVQLQLMVRRLEPSSRNQLSRWSSLSHSYKTNARGRLAAFVNGIAARSLFMVIHFCYSSRSRIRQRGVVVQASNEPNLKAFCLFLKKHWLHVWYSNEKTG